MSRLRRLLPVPLAAPALLLFAAFAAAPLAGCGDTVEDGGEVAQPEEPYEFPEDY